MRGQRDVEEFLQNLTGVRVLEEFQPFYVSPSHQMDPALDRSHPSRRNAQEESEDSRGTDRGT